MRHRFPTSLALFLAAALWLSFALAACKPATPTRRAGEGPGPEVVPTLPSLSPLTLAPGAKLRVVATTSIVGDVVKNVGGDLIALTVLMGIGQDPHSYQPVPADLKAIADADVLFASGAGLEEFLETTIKDAGGTRLIVHVSAGLQLRAGSGHEEEEHAEAVDPHVWFSVPNVVRWTENIAQVLSALDPAHADRYKANAQAYAARLRELDAWIAAQIATIPPERRKLVTNHPSFGYFAERYGLEQVGTVYPVSPSAEPSAQDIAKLEKAIQEYSVPAVFTESTVNPRLAEQVSRDTGVKLASLYTGSLGGPGSGAETYIDLMRYDTTTIVEALR